ncbi:hypothetical protein [Comamonas sp. NoAH]|uniref:hypothetical protein n=1 Tax=Comamonas halotolerans TaxID=3041496 RepID=UPI0024E04DA2|nr:hypothetical protein [Comamonas sp. NoAH]
MTEAQARQAFAAAKANIKTAAIAATAQVEEATREFDRAKQALQAFENHRASNGGVVTHTATGHAPDVLLADF